jgi:hypothetical protein
LAAAISRKAGWSGSEISACALTKLQPRGLSALAQAAAASKTASSRSDPVQPDSHPARKARQRSTRARRYSVTIWSLDPNWS